MGMMMIYLRWRSHLGGGMLLSVCQLDYGNIRFQLCIWQ